MSIKFTAHSVQVKVQNFRYFMLKPYMHNGAVGLNSGASVLVTVLNNVHGVAVEHAIRSTPFGSFE